MLIRAFSFCIWNKSSFLLWSVDLYQAVGMCRLVWQSLCCLQCDKEDLYLEGFEGCMPRVHNYVPFWNWWSYDVQCTKRALMQFANNIGPDQPVYLHRLTRTFVISLQNQWILYCIYIVVSIECSEKTQIRLHGCTDWSGHALFAKDIWILFLYYTLPLYSGGVLWFHIGRPCVRPSVCPSVVGPSVFCFRMITWVNINGFSPNLVCALILWRSGLGSLMGEFRYLPKTRPYFRFQMITWVNVNGFSPNLVCALILWRSGLGLLIGKFRQILTELSTWDMPIFSFPDDNE